MKYTIDQLEVAVKNSLSMMEVLRYLGIREAGGSHSHWKRKIKDLGIDTSHFRGQGHNAGKVSVSRKTSDDMLVLRTSGSRQKATQLRRALLEIGRKYVCDCCGQCDEWMGHKLTLDVDHIDENWLDDRAENLRFLCPNCHSQFSRRLKTPG